MNNNNIFEEVQVRYSILEIAACSASACVE